MAYLRFPQARRNVASSATNCAPTAPPPRRWHNLQNLSLCNENALLWTLFGGRPRILIQIMKSSGPPQPDVEQRKNTYPEASIHKHFNRSRRHQNRATKRWHAKKMNQIGHWRNWSHPILPHRRWLATSMLTDISQIKVLASFVSWDLADPSSSWDPHDPLVFTIFKFFVAKFVKRRSYYSSPLPTILKVVLTLQIDGIPKRTNKQTELTREVKSAKLFFTETKSERVQ